MRPSLASLAVLLALFGHLQSCSGPNEPAQSSTAPSAYVTIDSVVSNLGQTVEVPIRLTRSSGLTGLDSIQSFIINVTYNDSLIRCIGGRLGEADSGWGYLGWRNFPSHPPYDVRAEVLIKASRPAFSRPPRLVGESMPEGEIAVLTFEVAAGPEHVGRIAEISFSASTCEANTLVDATDRNRFHMMRLNRTNDSLVFELDTLNCIRRYTLVPDLEFVSGAIEITAPPYIPPDPAITVSVSAVSGHVRDTVQVEIIFDYGASPLYDPPGFGGFDLLLKYDTAAMWPVEVLKGPQLSGWEYFTWRNVSSTHLSATGHRGIRVVSILEMNNGTPATGPYSPRGSIAVLRLALSEDITPEGGCLKLAFHSEDAGDNVISDMSGDILFMPLVGQESMQFGMGYVFEGCGGVTDSCEHIIRFQQEGCNIR